MVKKSIRLVRYRGSLDFSCDFCTSNSYNNFQLEFNNKIFVFCDECLAEARVNGPKESLSKWEMLG